MTSWKEEDFITGFLFLAVIGHGMFFAREWLVLGAVFIVGSMIYRVKEFSAEKIRAKLGESWRDPAWILILMIFFSLTGLLQPVRSVEGWLEAFRWLVFLTAFLWGRHFADNKEIREKLMERILWVAFWATILTWLPGSKEVWLSAGVPEEGRFASSFGYPNAAAAFLGCQLLLLLKDKQVRFLLLAVFGLSVLNTGSRAAVILLALLALILISKKAILDIQKKPELTNLGFYKALSWTNYSKPIIFVAIILLLQQTVFHSQGSLHLLSWSDTSLPERMIYYGDSLKIAWYANFLPQAGGWLAFPFVQTTPYWTLDPHSSFFRIMLNQGLLGVILLGIWGAKGLKGYGADLVACEDLTVICSKTAVIYLGLHSLIDVDMSFGALGILFWLLVGLNTFQQN